jgi:hypothetical protein
MRQNSQLIGGKGDVRRSSLKQVQPVEIRNEGADSISRLMEEHNNWLSFDDLRLSERYLKGDVHVVLHLRLGDSGEYVACLRIKGGGGRFLQEASVRDLGWDGKDSQKVARDYPYLAWGHAVNNVLGINREQQAVLVDNVKLIELPENFSCTSSVCFDRRQRFYSFMPQSLFYSPNSGYKFLGAVCNWKVNLAAPVGFGADRDQSVGQMVESGPEVMNSIPKHEGDVGWDRRNIGEFIDAIASVRVVLGRKGIRASVDKGVPRLLEIEDVFFGPF